jgi:formylmethanofuran dehydrogenase subunit E
MDDSFETLLQKAEIAHGHMCAGQILGVRMSLLGLHSLGIENPLGADRKRLVAYVEIDRCATDAIGMVTGCRLGKRTLKFRDWGKMAATFVDLATDVAVRIVALENSRDLASQIHPEIESKSHQQMLAYRELSDDQLFRLERVRVPVHPSELPGYKAERVECARCGDGINFGRFEEVAGQRLCLTCAHPELCYWTSV